jgi:hypothetical protein
VLLIPKWANGLRQSMKLQCVGRVLGSGRSHYYRKVLIKMYWDNAEEPSVVVPLGLFCIGHSMPGNINTLPINISTSLKNAIVWRQRSTELFLSNAV